MPPRRKKAETPSTNPQEVSNPPTPLVNNLVTPTNSIPQETKTRAKKAREPTVYNLYVQKRMGKIKETEAAQMKKWEASDKKTEAPKFSAVERMNMVSNEWLSDSDVRAEMTKEFAAWKLTKPNKMDGTPYFREVKPEPATK
jgi:hypothetical protein